MDNGLQGRYQPQMAAWNDAQQFAGELIEAFFTSDTTITAVTEKWSEIRAYFPRPGKLKQIINDVVFSTTIEKVRTVARRIMQYDGWWK